MLQRLNLTAPERKIADPPAQSTEGCYESIRVNPAMVEEVQRRTKQTLASGEAPELLFVCGIPGGLLMLQHGLDKKSAMLLFTTPYRATDYMRATGAEPKIGQVKARIITGNGSDLDVFRLRRIRP